MPFYSRDEDSLKPKVTAQGQLAMFRPSMLSPQVLLKTDLSVDDLWASLLSINGMKVLQYASSHGGIPITKTIGNFHRRFVEWAAEEFNWRGYEPSVLYAVNKVLNEPDFPPLSILHDVFLSTRLMRHYRGKAVVTKAGTKMLGQYGELQAVMAETLLYEPLMYEVPLEDRLIFWDMGHMLGVLDNRLSDWVTVGEFTEWVVPVDLFPKAGPLGAKHEATLFIAANLIRPLVWLGLLEEAERDTPAMRMEQRCVRKTPLFNQSIRIMTPEAGSLSLH